MKKNILAIMFVAILPLILLACGDASEKVQDNSVGTRGNNNYVENANITVTVHSWDNPSRKTVTVQREGKYTGDIINGVPNGYGTFEAVNDDGIAWIYTGEFSNGIFDGYGKTVWGDDELTEEGNYADGTFAPTTLQLFNLLSAEVIAPYKISSKNQEYIEKHPGLFPATTDVDEGMALAEINPDLSYPVMEKSLDGLEGQLFWSADLHTTQVFEEFLYGHTLTAIIAVDSNMRYYFILYDGQLPDIYAEMAINVIGLPVSSSSFDNVGGGQTNVIVLIGSFVEKL